MKRFAATIAFGMVIAAVALSQQVFLRTGGSLRSSDAVSAGGGPVDRYEVRVPAGTLIAALAVAVDYTPELTVDVGAGPTRSASAVMGSAYATAYASRGGTIDVSVSAPEGSSGDYMLRVSEIPVVGSVSSGRSVAGVLSETDQQLADGRYIDWYSVSLSPEESVSLLASAEFDSYMIVQYPDGRRTENDDTSGTDAGALLNASDVTSYLVGVTSLSTGTIGPYTLVAESLAPPEPISIGEVVIGRLNPEEPADRYVVRGDEGTVALIRVDSEDFDTVLQVQDESGNHLENDDAPDGTTNSQLTYSFFEAGSAQILVRAFDGGGSGSYRLSVADAGSEYSVKEVSDGHMLESEEPVTTVLRREHELPDGRTGHRFTFRARRNQRVTAFVESDAFDTFMEVHTPGGTVVQDDDSRGNGDSELSFIADAAGIYDLYATSYEGTSVGLYTVGVDLGAIVNVLARERGDLSTLDTTDDGGRYFDEVSVTLSAKRPVYVSAESDAFDTYIYVYGPDGALVAENDDGGQTSNSRLEFSPSQSGRFRVRITSYSEGNTGSYDLTVAETAR